MANPDMYGTDVMKSGFDETPREAKDG